MRTKTIATIPNARRGGFDDALGICPDHNMSGMKKMRAARVATLKKGETVMKTVIRQTVYDRLPWIGGEGGCAGARRDRYLRV